MKKLVVVLMACISLFGAQRTIVFTTGEWEPYVGETMVDYGPASKVITTVCERLNYKCEIEFMPWRRAYEMAKRGKVPATYLWTPTEKRSEEMFEGKEPVGFTRTYTFYRKSKFPDGLELDSYEAIAKSGYKPVAVNGYVQADLLEDAGAEPHIVREAKLAWMMIEKNRADINVANDLVGFGDIKKYAPAILEDMATSSKPVAESKMKIFFSRVHPDGKELMNEFDKVLAEMNKAGEIDKIYKDFM